MVSSVWDFVNAFHSGKGQHFRSWQTNRPINIWLASVDFTRSQMQLKERFLQGFSFKYLTVCCAKFLLCYLVVVVVVVFFFSVKRNHTTLILD